MNREPLGAAIENLDLVADGDLAEDARHAVPAEKDAVDAWIGGSVQRGERAERLAAGDRPGRLVAGRDDAAVAGLDEIELGVTDLEAAPKVLGPGHVAVDDDVGAEA